MPPPQVLWDWGTAYDLFVSLDVLHDPAYFGVRGSWAAGVRARLQATARETLDQSRVLGHAPLHWLHDLPDPKDGITVLWALGQIPPGDRLSRLALPPEKASAEMQAVLQSVSARGRWNERDQRALTAIYQQLKGEKSPLSQEEVATILDCWAHPVRFGERYLEALHAYHQVFFAEEERRIGPALQVALSRAQELAERMALPDLLEELTGGLRIEEQPDVAELVLVPSFWSTPIMYFENVSASRAIRLFGARPPDVSLVPGEVVPDALLRALKALSDPTRLRILHYMAEEPLTPAQLGRRLRLRAPTVTHHLKILRLAGLVQVSLDSSKAATRYATRSSAIRNACSSLQGFLGADRGDHTE